MIRASDEWPDAFDLPPQTWVECRACDGEGTIVKRVTVYEHGCGFPHDDGHEVICDACGGAGGRMEDVECDPPRQWP